MRLKLLLPKVEPEVYQEPERCLYPDLSRLNRLVPSFFYGPHPGGLPEMLAIYTGG